eukprot:scaffold8029_cov71-Phaeocystis_antarctica.AAC.4
MAAASANLCGSRPPSCSATGPCPCSPGDSGPRQRGAHEPSAPERSASTTASACLVRRRRRRRLRLGRRLGRRLRRRLGLRLRLELGLGIRRRPRRASSRCTARHAYMVSRAARRAPSSALPRRQRFDRAAVPREQAQEVARVPVRVADHRCNTEALGVHERGRRDCRVQQRKLHAPSARRRAWSQQGCRDVGRQHANTARQFRETACPCDLRSCRHSLLPRFNPGLKSVVKLCRSAG